MSTYFAGSFPTFTTGPAAKQTLAASGTTYVLLQIAPSAGNPATVYEWGVSFDQSVAGMPAQCELISGTTAQTGMTAHVASGITTYLRSADAGASGVTLGTAATGYGAVTATTPGTVRMGDIQNVAPTNQYVKQFPLGREFFVAGGQFMQIRVTPRTASLGVYAYCVFFES
jgi:hypothetical protein